MRRVLPAALGSALLAAGCGGGVWIGASWGDDGSPSIALAVSPRDAAPGQGVALSASVTDAGDLPVVSFYRLDGDQAVLITRDRDPPYTASTTAPADGRSTLRLFAEVRDDLGRVGSSAIESVAVR